MIRLIIVVEGQSEEAFVKDVLYGHLMPLGVHISATIVGKTISQKRGHRQRGGGHFRHWKRDIERILLGDGSDDLRVTTLFDLYGLPSDFPGLEKYGNYTDTLRRCENLETALAAEFNDKRFVPYIQRHEFESLVLASLAALRELLDAQDDLDGLTRLEADIADSAPEEINDGKLTAPSKRLEASVPGYNKTVHGPLATSGTGIVRLRESCPRFSAWLETLEGFSSQARHP